MQLNEARVVVTGGTSGVGRALCEAFGRAGARVVTCGTNRRRVEECGALTGVVRSLLCDVTEAEDIRALAAAVDVHLGGLDVLVNCAGIQRNADAASGLDMSEVEREVAINLVAPIAVTNALMPQLLASPRAAIVNVTSVLAMAPKQVAPVYCATKAGLSSWTTALRYQLEPRSVKVMELVPPVVATPMTHGRQEGAVEPEAVAEACLDGLRGGRSVVAVGKARLAAFLHHLAPGLLARRLRFA